MADVVAQIHGNSTIWITSVSSWSGKDKLTAADLGKHPDDILEIMNLGNKSLLMDDVRVGLHKASSQLTTLFSSIGKRFFIRGAWLVPNSHFMLAKTGVEKIRGDQGVFVEDLIDNIEDIKSEMIERFPILVDAKWPTDNQIRNRFSVQWHVCEIHGAEISEADPEELAQAKFEFQQELTKTYEEYSEQILQETKVAILDAIHEISKKIEDGQKITAATMKKPQRVIEDYLNIAQIFSLEDVQGEVLRLKSELESTDAADIRGNWDFAQEFAGTIKGMANSIGDLSGLSSDGTVKRVVRRKAA